MMKRAKRSLAGRNGNYGLSFEALEGRAYLSGAVFGAPQNLSATVAGIAPVYAILDNVFSSTHSDLVVANVAAGSVPNSVSVLPGTGTGTFGTAHTVPLSFAPLTIADGLLGTNGKTDIVVGSTNSSTVGVILQDSSGTLTETDYTATGLADTQSVAVADFNGDGHPDIAVASDDSGTANNVAIFLNSGTGTFTLHQVLSVPHANLSSLTNFNGGTRQDLAVSSQSASKVTTILNDGAGNFSIGTDYSVGNNPVTIKAGQFNLNSNTNDDLVTANLGGGNVSVLIGNGDGTFSATPINTAVAGLTAGGGPLKVRVSNLTNSGKPDLLALLPAGSAGDSEVLLGNGDGTFHVGNIISTGGATRTAIAGGDLNGDGLTDVVLVDKKQITALLNETNQDTAAPTAAVDLQQPTNAAGAAVINFTVTYTDARQIDTTTLASSNVVVTNAAGTALPVTLVSTGLANAAAVTVTYSIPATGGSLSTADNGTYTVTTTSGGTAVKNANGVAVVGGANIGTFTLLLSDGGGGGGGGTVSGPNLTATVISGKLPATAVAGTVSKTPLSVVITNNGTTVIKGKIVIQLFISTDGAVHANPAPLKSITKAINLKLKKSVKVLLPKFTWPAGTNGSYFIVANVNATNIGSEVTHADNFAVSTKAVAVAPPFVDIQNLWNGAVPAGIKAGKRVSLTIALKNLGNVNVSKSGTLKILASTDGTVGNSVALASPTVHFAAGPQKKQTLHVSFKVPAIAAGTYKLLVVVPNVALDTDAGDKNVTSTGTFTI